MAIVVFGLGNDGLPYYNTKHNVGRLIAQFMVKNLDADFKSKSNFYFAKLDDDTYFLYTSGFMNECGFGLATFLKYFKLDNSDTRLLIIQDDSDQLELSQKFTQSGGSGGHRGIDSVYKHLLSLNIEMNNIWRLKIGIRPENFHGKSLDFVLKSVSKIQMNHLELTARHLTENITILKTSPFDKMVNELNINNLN